MANDVNEREWVERVKKRLVRTVGKRARGGVTLHIEAGKYVPYASATLSYDDSGPQKQVPRKYQTDLLFSDHWSDEGVDRWAPRVILECKLRISTHDALTYAAKATTHKHLHPYLRYGILVGRCKQIPRRLLWHGTSFDFILTWRSESPSPAEWRTFTGLIRQEVRTARMLVGLNAHPVSMPKLLHRPVRIA